MIDILKIEIAKIVRSKSFLWMIILLSASISLTLLGEYYFIVANKNEQPNLVHLIYSLYAVNATTFFPLIIAYFFISVLNDEFKLKTIKILFGSIMDRETIYMAKFIASAVIFVSIFSIMILASTVLISIVTDINRINIEYYAITYQEALWRIIITTIIGEAYFLCIGSYSMLIDAIFENQGVAVIIFFMTVLLCSVIPLPQWLTNYFFLKGQTFFAFLDMFEFDWLEFMKYVALFIVYIAAFNGIGCFIFSKKQI